MHAIASQDPLTDKAAEHISFLADVNQLYDTSLGLYNLDLALLIAQQSQKVGNISGIEGSFINHAAGPQRILASSAIIARSAPHSSQISN